MLCKRRPFLFCSPRLSYSLLISSLRAQTFSNGWPAPVYLKARLVLLTDQNWRTLFPALPRLVSSAVAFLHPCPFEFYARLRTRPRLVIARGGGSGVEALFGHCSTSPASHMAQACLLLSPVLKALTFLTLCTDLTDGAFLFASRSDDALSFPPL